MASERQPPKATTGQEQSVTVLSWNVWPPIPTRHSTLGYLGPAEFEERSMLSKLSVNLGPTWPGFMALCFLLTTYPSYAGSGASQMVKPLESLQSLLAQGQRQQQQFGNFHVDGRISCELRQVSSQDLAVSKKREGIRKAITAMGFTIFFFASLFFGSLGGAALNKTLGSEGRKKGIKWIVVALLLLALANYWDDVVIVAMSFLTD